MMFPGAVILFTLVHPSLDELPYTDWMMNGFYFFIPMTYKFIFIVGVGWGVGMWGGDGVGILVLVDSI